MLCRLKLGGPVIMSHRVYARRGLHFFSVILNVSSIVVLSVRWLCAMRAALCMPSYVTNSRLHQPYLTLSRD